MKIQPGDYMVWFGSKTKTGECGFCRQSRAGSALERLRFPNGDDKFYAYFVRTSSDFRYLSGIIAQTHDMDVMLVGPDENAHYNAFLIHDAMRFVSRSKSD